jgi:hypothetical protein
VAKLQNKFYSLNIRENHQVYNPLQSLPSDIAISPSDIATKISMQNPQVYNPLQVSEQYSFKAERFP